MRLAYISRGLHIPLSLVIPNCTTLDKSHLPIQKKKNEGHCARRKRMTSGAINLAVSILVMNFAASLIIPNDSIMALLSLRRTLIGIIATPDALLHNVKSTHVGCWVRSNASNKQRVNCSLFDADTSELKVPTKTTGVVSSLLIHDLGRTRGHVSTSEEP